MAQSQPYPCAQCTGGIYWDFQGLQTTCTFSYPRVACTGWFSYFLNDTDKKLPYRKALFIFVYDMYRLARIQYRIWKCYLLMKLPIIWLCLALNKGSDLITVIISCHLDLFKFNCMVLAVKQHIGLHILDTNRLHLWWSYNL